MNQYKKKMYDLSGPKTAEALNKRHFEAYYCSTAAEAVEKVLELTPKTDVVSWGGAMTVDELGIKQRMAQEGYTLLDRDTAQTPEEKQAIMRQALTCGTFLMSSNAISKDGQLVNIDGNGNRVAAMCFGAATAPAPTASAPSWLSPGSVCRSAASRSFWWARIWVCK